MLPMKSLRLSLGEALAADAASLAPAANANEIALIGAAFTPGEDLVIGDLTILAGDGLDAIVGAIGAQLVGVDPSSGQQVITIKEPVGGYRWELTGAPAPPAVVFGFALTTSAAAALLAVQALTTPVTLTDIGDFIDIGNAQLTIVLEPIS